MSHSISLACTHCGSRVFESNLTANLTPMLREAGIYLGDERWKEHPGIDMLPTLQRAIDQMLDDPERFKAMNPANGWGDYGGAIKTLTTLRDSIARNPDATYSDWH